MTRKLLIVEDEAIIVMLLEQVLEPLRDEGVELLIANDGAEGLAMIRAHRPELVLLDGMMPVMSGFEVCRVVKSDEALRGIRVAMITARARGGERSATAAPDADHFFLKPFEPDEVLGYVRRVLGLAG